MSLRKMGYEPTETECPECEEGTLFVNSFELVCNNCRIVFRKGEKPPDYGGGPVEYFRNNRDDFTYDGSGLVMCLGGFPSAYYGPGLYGEGE